MSCRTITPQAIVDFLTANGLPAQCVNDDEDGGPVEVAGTHLAVHIWVRGDYLDVGVAPGEGEGVSLRQPDPLGDLLALIRDHLDTPEMVQRLRELKRDSSLIPSEGRSL